MIVCHTCQWKSREIILFWIGKARSASSARWISSQVITSPACVRRVEDAKMFLWFFCQMLSSSSFSSGLDC
jgi:hypothetical protein